MRNGIVDVRVAPAATAKPPLQKLLCVDDDPNILEGIARNLRKRFDIHAAVGPQEGLEAIRVAGPFGVVVSDFNMPGMNGVEFFTKIRAIAPDSVRIMLTGQADFSTAMGAVNQGNIFRFLLKPCVPMVLEKVVEAGFEQHRLLLAERELTEKTLLGCVQVLVEILSIVQPEAFSRANRVRRFVKQACEHLGVNLPWQVDAAAMLSQIGWITLPPEVLAKASQGEALTPEELGYFLPHASVAARILEKVPRLDQVALIIEQQHKPRGPAAMTTAERSDPLVLGPHLLKAAIDLDVRRQGGLSHDNAIRALRESGEVYVPDIIDALAAIEQSEAKDEIRLVPLHDLAPGMIMEEELRNKNGLLLLGRGHEIPETFLRRLQNHSYGLQRDLLCKVRIPTAPH